MVLVKNLKYFLVFILVKIGQKNVFDDILERKKAFLHYENRKLKKLKNFHFSKAVSPQFWSKIWNIYIFSQDVPEKCVWRYSRKEKEPL